MAIECLIKSNGKIVFRSQPIKKNQLSKVFSNSENLHLKLNVKTIINQKSTTL